MKTLHNALFLHGGPGLHAAVERAWFGDALPILWWDQPSVAADPTPFRTLVAHAASQLETLADTVGERVDLIAHSFGGQIAVALTREYPALIRNITLLGCSPDPIRGFIIFARRLIEAGYEHPGLRDALAAVEESCDENSFSALTQACYALSGIYFGPNSAKMRERYFAIAGETPPVDTATFFAVMREFLHAPPPAQITGYGGEVAMLMGEHDPVLCVDEDREKWRGVFPQAEFKLVDAGHIVHLELPPQAWCGER